LLLLLPLPAQAGMGYPIKVSIAQIEVQNKKTQTQLIILNPSQNAFNGCSTIFLELHYKRIPWYSFLPLTRGSHPSYREHKKALSFLKEAHNKKKNINFGLFGSGVHPTQETCHYESRGLQLFSTGKESIVASFYEPI